MGGGGSSKRQVVGYQYYAGMHLILSRGPIDFLKRVRVDKRLAYRGNMRGGRIFLNKLSLFGGGSREGGVYGNLDVEFGAPDQEQNPYLKARFGATVSAFRTVVGVVFRQPYLGQNPYLKTWDFRISRIFTRQDGIEQWYPEYAQVSRAEYSLPFNEDFENLDSYTLEEGSLSAFSVANSILTIQSGVSSNDLISRVFSEGEAVVTSVTCSFRIMDSGVDDAGVIQLYDSSGNRLFVFNPRRQSTSDPLRRPIFASTGASETFNSPTLSLSAWYTLRAYYSPFDDLWTFNLYLNSSGGLVHSQQIEGGGASKATKVTFSMQNQPDGCGTQYTNVSIERSSADGDMNPAHIIRETLTDPDWGMGHPEADIDDDAFALAARTLHSESFGLSLVWDRKKEIEEFIQDVLRHIDATLFVSPKTGKFVLKLIRGDYALSELVRLDEDSVVKVDDYSQTTFGNLVNSLSVDYYNPDLSSSDTVGVQDIALVQQQGSIVETTVSYPGINSSELAARVAQRDLITLSTQLVSCVVYADRTAAELNPGDAFILDWPEDLISNMVMRVQSISYGTTSSNTIKIQCTQDVYETPDNAIVFDSGTSTEQDQTALPADIRISTEVPYYSLVLNQGDAAVATILDNNPYAGYAVTAAVEPNSAHLSGDLLNDDGSGYTSVDAISFCPCGEIIAPLDHTTTSFYLDQVASLDTVDDTFLWFQMGDEIMRLDSIELDSSGYYLVEVGRGCLDTTPQEHQLDSAGRYAIFWDSLNGTNGTEYDYGEQVLAKVITHTGEDSLDAVAAPVDVIDFRSRLNLPYPPGNLLIQGESYPEVVDPDSSDMILVEWSHRDRVQQTGGTIYDHTTGDIGPEPGTTYTLKLLDEFDIVRYEASGISDTFASVDLSILLSEIAAIEVSSVRDGFESWMPARHRFAYTYLDSTIVDSAGSDIFSAGSAVDFDSSQDGINLDSPDLAMFYEFETSPGRTADSSGNGITLIQKGSPNYTSGYIGDAVYGNSYSALYTAYGEGPTGDILVSCWFYIPSGASGTNVVWSQTPANSGNQFRGLFFTDTEVRVITRDSTLASNIQLGAPRPAEEVWHHAVFKQLGTELKFWLNGVLVDTDTIADEREWTGRFTVLARLPNDLEGRAAVDHVRVYETADQDDAFIEALYNET